MKNIARRTRAVGLLAVLMLGVSITSQAQLNFPSDRKVGEIFVAVGGGQYQVWHFDFSTIPPTATLVEKITNGTTTDNNAGCAFNSTYHPFTTDVTANNVFKDMIHDPQNAIQTITPPARTTLTQPTSIAFDSAGNFYVGQAGGTGLIEEYGPSGSLVQTLPVGQRTLRQGASPWLDLSKDGGTIYFTNGSDIVYQYVFSTNKVSPFARIPGGPTLHALRVLTPAGQTATASLSGGPGFLVVAAVFKGFSNIQLLNSSGATIQTYSVTTPVNEANFQVITLDPDGTSLWAGNPATHNFYRFNLATGIIEVNAVNTGVSSGPSGLCAYGGFSAAEPQPLTVTANLTPSVNTTNAVCTSASAANTMDCTFSTLVPPPSPPEACPTTVTTPATNNCFIITVNGINLNAGHAPNGLQLTYNYSQIDPADGTSDTVVEDTGSGMLACDLTSPDGKKCEVHSVDLNPDNASNQTNIYATFDLAFFSTQGTAQGIVNPRVVRDGNADITDFVIQDFHVGGSQSVFTINELPLLPAVAGSQSCGYTSPLINSQYNKGRTVPVKFQAVTPPNTCAAGPSFMANLAPRLVLLQFGSSDAAPHPVAYTLNSGGSCPPYPGCYYRRDPSSNTWILNVDTASLQGGGTMYFGTTFDDANQIPSFSNTASGFPVDTFTVN